MLSRERELQGTFSVCANLIWKCLGPWRRDRGGRKLAFPLCSSVIPECRLDGGSSAWSQVLRGGAQARQGSVHGSGVRWGSRGGVVQGGGLWWLLL